MWHSHPYGEAAPSPTDKIGMRVLVTPLANSPSRALIVIVGGDKAIWSSWVDNNAAPDIFVQLVTRDTDNAPREAPPAPASHRAEGWPGGWGSRPRSHRPTKRRRRLLTRRLRKALRLR
jgi:hypothetical protein